MFVKICGIMSVEQARLCVDAGADAIGVNLVSASPRCIDVALAKEIALAVRPRARVVAVVANRSVLEMRTILRETQADFLQLHGDESPSDLDAVLPAAYKAARIGSAEDVKNARAFAGDWLLTDAKVTGALGGTGQRADWPLIAPLARERKVILAGGLTPENALDAIRAVRPFGVDVASGVEAKDARAGTKDIARVKMFINSAHSA